MFSQYQGRQTRVSYYIHFVTGLDWTTHNQRYMYYDTTKILQSRKTKLYTFAYDKDLFNIIMIMLLKDSYDL